MKAQAQNPAVRGEPDFNNVLAVLRRRQPARPTLFELFLNNRLYSALAGSPDPQWPADLKDKLTIVYGFRNAGYDYATFHVPNFGFPAGEFHQQATRSINEGAVIADRAGFAAYRWPDPEAGDYGILDRILPYLPRGMKVIICGPGGVLENAIRLVGYEQLCYMLLDDPRLAREVFEAIGSRLVSFYGKCLARQAVGAIFGNDDWGFKSQTMLSPADMRKYVFPWHRRIVAAAHAAGKPAILHSCGCLESVMDDVIDDLGYDGKHSYEDAIMPVEDAYDRYRDRIAILGGIDVDFVCRSTPEAVRARAAAMLDRAAAGGYALGTGNSVPEYVPDANYFAMIGAALDRR